MHRLHTIYVIYVLICNICTICDNITIYIGEMAYHYFFFSKYVYYYNIFEFEGIPYSSKRVKWTDCIICFCPHVCPHITCRCPHTTYLNCRCPHTTYLILPIYYGPLYLCVVNQKKISQNGRFCYSIFFFCWRAVYCADEGVRLVPIN